MATALTDFFGLPGQLSALEQPVAEPALEVQRLVTRAWYLRQRDTGAALADAKAAQDLLHALPIDDAQRASGRLTLVRAENAWLFGELDKARGLIDEARQIFQWACDAEGLGDCHLCEAGQIEGCDDPEPGVDTQAQAQAQERLAALRAAGAAYGRADGEHRDPIRLALVQVWSVCTDLAAALPLLDPALLTDRLAQPGQLGHAGVDHFVALARARLAGLRGRRAEAIEEMHTAFQAAQVAGQLFRAIGLAHGIGQAFARLGDQEGALHWLRYARELVQPTGWPRAACHSLVQSATVHLALGHDRVARDLLMNHLPTLQRFPVSKDYVQAAQVLGQALLALREPQDALAWIEVSERVATQLRLHGEVAASLRLKAQALSRLGRADEALATAQAALHTLRDQPDAQCEAGVLHTIAEVARTHGLAMPADPDEAAEQEVNAAMHHMRRAFAVAERVPGFFVPPSWHAEFSQDHQAVGDLELALRHQRLATAGFEQVVRQQVMDLEAALRVRQHIEKETVAASQHRVLEQASRERAALVRAHRDTLAHLAIVQQDLARCTDAPGLFATLGRHAASLLDACAVAVWQVQGQAGDTLELAWGLEDEQPMSPATLPVGDGSSPPWTCLRTRQELQLDGIADPSAAAPKAPSHGGTLLLPLLACGDALGVMVIQSRHAGAYGEQDRHLPRSMAATLAQALAGMAARDRLVQAGSVTDAQHLQGLFMHTGRMAAVARLATQVARELDAPLGTLADLAGGLTTALEQRHLPGLTTTARSMQHEVERLGRLAQRLRNEADAATTPHLARRDVRSVFDEARGLFGARLATEHIVCDEAIPPLTVQADTERLSLTIANLVFNAADAMEGRSDKHLWLSAEQRGSEIALSVRDNGPGLPGDAPQGPGMALAAQSVAAMRGRITADNASGGGAVFTIVLPAASPP